MPEEGLETQEVKERLEADEEELEKEREEVERVRAPSWTLALSLSTAIIAVFAAVASLQSGSHANAAILSKNEAVLSQARASDRWAYYQAKGLRQAIYASQSEALADTNAEQARRLHAESEHYREEQAEIEKSAKELEAAVAEAGKRADESLERHHQFAIAVTVFQVAIALAAIAALTRRRGVWFVSLAIGVAGLVFFVRGFGGG